MNIPLWAQQILAAYLLFGTVLAGMGIMIRYANGYDRRDRFLNPVEVLFLMRKIATWPYGIYKAVKQVTKEMRDG